MPPTLADVCISERFRHRKRVWRRVPKAVDRLGGYNAQLDGGDRRALFFAHQEVEALLTGDREDEIAVITRGNQVILF